MSLKPEDPQWFEKAQARSQKGDVEPVPWANEPWYNKPYCGTKLANGKVCGCSGIEEAYPIHFAEMAPDEEHAGMVRYYASEKHGAQGRWTYLSPGRYLAKYFEDKGPQEIERWVAACKALVKQVIFAETRKQVKDVYEHPSEVGSCMSKPASTFGTQPVHPCEVYGTKDVDNDIAVAYIKDHKANKIKARAVVRRSNKKYGRIYGDYATFEKLMQRMGYTPEVAGAHSESKGVGGFEGAKLAFIPHPSEPGHVCCPYMDLGHRIAVAEDGSHLFMTMKDHPLKVGDYNLGARSLPPRCKKCQTFYPRPMGRGGAVNIRMLDGTHKAHQFGASGCPKCKLTETEPDVEKLGVFYVTCVACGTYMMRGGAMAGLMHANSGHARALPVGVCKVCVMTVDVWGNPAFRKIAKVPEYERSGDHTRCWDCLETHNVFDVHRCSNAKGCGDECIWTFDADGKCRRWERKRNLNTGQAVEPDARRRHWAATVKFKDGVMLRVPLLDGYAKGVRFVTNSSGTPGMNKILRVMTFGPVNNTYSSVAGIREVVGYAYGVTKLEDADVNEE